MTALLSRLFVRDYENTGSPAVRRSYGTMVSIVCIVLNLLLSGMKIVAGMLSGALSVTADGVNNLSDAASQIVSLISFRISAKPPDRTHPFGHARIEYVASLVVSVVILIVGWELFTGSLDALISGQAAAGDADKGSIFVVAVLVGSVLTKLWMYVFNRKIAARISSSVMRATAADSLSDVAATGAVLLGTLFSRFTGLRTDAWFGLAVSVLIMIGGLRILNENKNAILGRAPDAATVQQIRSIMLRTPGILGVHDIVVHNYGPGYSVVTLHAEVDGRESVVVAHDAVDSAERALLHEMGVHATIHMDPVAPDDRQNAALQERVSAILHGIDPRIGMHDFRCVSCNGAHKLIFDVAVPYELKYSDAQLRDLIGYRIREIDPSDVAVITVDRV